MKKCYIQNLAMIVTEECNLDCKHCLRGEKSCNNITDDVIESTLSQVMGIGNLAINGGEPTLVIDRLEKIISCLIEKNIMLEEFTVTINGTIYSKELLELLDYINSYIGSNDINALFAISIDKYHLDEIDRLGIMREFKTNIDKYKKNKYFYGFRSTNKKLFREGNAVNLDEKLTVPLRPLKTVITYVDESKKLDIQKGLCNIGPLVTINTNGIITEGDSSNLNQKRIYNYGNVLNDSIEDVCIRNGAPILKPKDFERTCKKLLKKYRTYNK